MKEIPMTPVQEIEVSTSKGKFVIEIENSKGFKFAVSPIDYPNDWMFENDKVFNSVDECFKDVISGIKKYCDKNSIDIYDIDNPCNCELISADNQKSISQELNMFIPIKINGNLR